MLLDFARMNTKADVNDYCNSLSRDSDIGSDMDFDFKEQSSHTHTFSYNFLTGNPMVRHGLTISGTIQIIIIK